MVNDNQYKQKWFQDKILKLKQKNSSTGISGKCILPNPLTQTEAFSLTTLDNSSVLGFWYEKKPRMLPSNKVNKCTSHHM